MAENPTKPLRILFVCYGNICRSPTAEGLFKALAEEDGVSDRFVVDSAGTAGFHEGEPPESRTAKAAARHGLKLEGRARKAMRSDFSNFDLIVAMDAANANQLKRVAQASGLGARAAPVVKMRDFDSERPGADVQDPYYMGGDAFENTFQVLRRSCRGLLDHLLRHGPMKLPQGAPGR